MAYVKNFEYDVFVSYAHADNSADAADDFWVSHFKRQLQAALKQLLAGGDDLAIFFDESSLKTNHQLVQLTAAAANSALFLAIKSPSYAKREWTRKELAAFIATQPALDRLFAIECLPLDTGKTYPEPLQNHAHLPFWEPDPHNEIPLRLSPTNDKVKFNRLIQQLAKHIQMRLESPIPPNKLVKPEPIAQADNPLQANSPFVGKVREEIRKILVPQQSATLALRDILLDGQPANTKPEEMLVPTQGTVNPESAIRFWRQKIKACLEQRPELVRETKQCAKKVLGWLALLVVKEHEIAKHQGLAVDLSHAAQIIVPVQTPAGTGIFVARLFEKQAKFELQGFNVHCTGWIDPGKLENGFFPADRLREIELLIYSRVMLTTEQPKSPDWLKDLRNTLMLRREDDKQIYYFTIPQIDYSDDLRIIGQLKNDLPHLSAIIIGTDNIEGDSILVMDETLLVPLLREFLLMLENFA